MKNYFYLVLLTLFLYACTKSFLRLDELILNDIYLKLNSKQYSDFVDTQEKWKFLPYFIITILLLIKTTLVASVLYIGTFFYSKIKVTFKQLLKVTINAEFVFLLVAILKIIWFYFFQSNYTLEDFQYFYPLSALNIIGYKGLESYFIYPFQVLNLFELFYILLLGFYVGKLTYTTKEKGKSMDFGLKIVASSYIPALLLWVALVMFFTLNNS